MAGAAAAGFEVKDDDTFRRHAASQIPTLFSSPLLFAVKGGLKFDTNFPSDILIMRSLIHISRSYELKVEED